MVALWEVGDLEFVFQLAMDLRDEARLHASPSDHPVEAELAERMDSVLSHAGRCERNMLPVDLIIM